MVYIQASNRQLKAMSEFQSPQKAAPSTSSMPEAQGRTLPPPALDLSEKERLDTSQPGPSMDRSARIKGDASLRPYFDGAKTLRFGDKGIDVNKMQQALIDMGYPIPLGSMGNFDTDTVLALKKYQSSVGVPDSGVLDRPTMMAMDKRFDTRKDYLQAADDFDPADPTKGTKLLSSTEKTEALKALKPQPAVAGKTFNPADAPAYAKEIKAGLKGEIGRLHKELYASQKAKRKDPAKNFHKDSNLEGAANAGKDVTDKVYGDLAKGPAFKMGTNLIDQWKDQEDAFKVMAFADKKDLAEALVNYLIDANLGDINKKYNATPSDPEEAKALAPVITSFINTKDKVKRLNEIDTGWPGAQLNGVQYLQVFKDPTKEENRKRLWSLFHVSIHEYIHTLAHPDYQKWEAKLGGAQEHTLAEGFCDFFTLNVRAKFPATSLTALKKDVEGDFYDAGKPVPDVRTLDVGVYDSHEEAERMVGIIGIRNAQLGYFRGLTKFMGA